MRAQITIGLAARTPEQIDRWCDSHSIVEPSLLLNSQDIDAIKDYFGDKGKAYGIDEITGALAVIDNGDYSHIWITWDRAPYSSSAIYHKATLRLV